MAECGDFASGAPNRNNAFHTRDEFEGSGFTQMSILPVARGTPCAATAKAPTIRNSTFSADNADNISA